MDLPSSSTLLVDLREETPLPTLPAFAPSGGQPPCQEIHRPVNVPRRDISTTPRCPNPRHPHSLKPACVKKKLHDEARHIGLDTTPVPGPAPTKRDAETGPAKPQSLLPHKPQHLQQREHDRAHHKIPIDDTLLKRYKAGEPLFPSSGRSEDKTSFGPSEHLAPGAEGSEVASSDLAPNVADMPGDAADPAGYLPLKPGTYPEIPLTRSVHPLTRPMMAR